MAVQPPVQEGAMPVGMTRNGNPVFAFDDVLPEHRSTRPYGWAGDPEPSDGVPWVPDLERCVAARLNEFSRLWARCSARGRGDRQLCGKHGGPLSPDYEHVKRTSKAVRNRQRSNERSQRVLQVQDAAYRLAWMDGTEFLAVAGWFALYGDIFKELV